jgi:hypothetical protein
MLGSFTGTRRHLYCLDDGVLDLEQQKMFTLVLPGG